MKLATYLITIAFPSLAAAGFFGGQTVIDDDLSVPGKNPLSYCQKPVDDIIEIDHVDLSEIAAGKTLTIEAVGNFTEEVVEGAYIFITVKYGLITLLHTKEDFCDQLKNIDKECPVKKGKTVVTKDVELPKQIPPGKYTVLADAYTADDRKLTCLTASVQFKR